MKWAVECIASLDPEHTIFTKGFISKKKILDPDEIFDNHDGLLDDFVFTGKGSSKKVKR